MTPRPGLDRIVQKALKVLQHRNSNKTRKPSGSSYDDAPSKYDAFPIGDRASRQSSIYSPDLNDHLDANSSLLPFPVRRPSSFLPTFGDAESVISLFSRHRTSRDTTMLVPPAIEDILNGSSATHQQRSAIRDNPPPFARYSAPEPRAQQALRRATLVHQERLAYEQRCMSLDEEREHLAAQLELVTQELARAEYQLESAKEEIVVREETAQEQKEQSDRHILELQEKCDRLKFGIDRAADCLGSTAAELRDLQKDHAKCSEREKLLETRIETLSNCKFKSRSQLKRKIDELQDRCQNFQALEEKIRNLQVDYITTSMQAEGRDSYLHQIRSQEQRIELLEGRRKEDAEEIRIAQTELFGVHQRLREAQRELKRRDLALEIVMFNNRDLSLDVDCLKQQLKGISRVYPPKDSAWPPLCRVQSLQIVT